ncbi:MCE family protein [candidate division KSB1 bacterium]|nr:MCE family protein [candidate division KSB1 bacterium]RQW00463.1 MAG: MCE family protein [candidate division KSB1 bacterium]
MKTREQMEKSHEIKVGLMILIGIAIIIFVIFAVGQQQGILEERYVLNVYMARVNGLQTGAPVRLNGVRVGSVTGVGFPDDLNNPQIRVSLEILTRVQDRIRADSEAFIGTLGLLGDKFVSITMGSMDYAVLKNGDFLRGTDPIDVEKLIDESVATFDELKETTALLKEISDKINRGEGTIGLLVNDPGLYKNINESLTFFTNLGHQLNSSEGLLAQILRDTTMYDELYTFLKNANVLADSLVNGSGSAAKLVHDPGFYNELIDNLEEIKAITAKLNQGEGTAGQLLTNAKLYDDLVRVTTDLDSLVNDIRENPKRYVTIKVF